jgi:hypothetical protein
MGPAESGLEVADCLGSWTSMRVERTSVEDPGVSVASVAALKHDQRRLPFRTFSTARDGVQ